MKDQSYLLNILLCLVIEGIGFVFCFLQVFAHQPFFASVYFAPLRLFVYFARFVTHFSSELDFNEDQDPFTPKTQMQNSPVVAPKNVTNSKRFVLKS